MIALDQIRAILKGRAAISREMLEPLVDEYSEQVQRVNERLQRCEGLLRKGLRSEAIQLADLEPRLLDQVTLLDFPELEDWEEILRFYGLQIPTSLLVDVALQLQDAMLSEQPLSSVLKQQRKLAIARAPLSLRLRVLRQIARLDPGNVNWSEDVEAWEKVRLKELYREVDDAIGKSNLDRLEQMNEEIEGERWLIKPPESLGKRLGEKIKSLRLSAILSQLNALAAQLNQAFCEMDSQQGKALAQQWQQTVTGISQVPPAIWQVAEPALAWIEEMEKERQQREIFETMSQRLRDSIHDRSRVTDVMRLHQSLVRMDLGIEPSLERLYQSFLENRRIEGQRRTRLIMAGLVGSLLIVAGLIGVVLWQRADLNREMEIAKQLEKLVKDKKYDEASSFINQMNSSAPEMVKRPSVTKLVEEVNQWVAKEKDRQKQFEDYLVRADSTDDAKIDLDAVVQAERLARSESEKGRAFVLRKRHTVWEQNTADRQREDARGELKKVKASIVNVEAKEALDINENDLSVLRKQLGDIPINYPRCGDLVLREVKQAEKGLMDLAQSVREMKSRMQMGERLVKEVRSAPSTEKLVTALEDFNARVLGVSLNPDFDSALAEKDAWGVAEKWNRWAVSLGKFLEGSGDSAEAVRLATAWDNDIKGIRNLPPAKAYPEISEDLETMESRKELLDAYKNDLIDSSWYSIGTVMINEESIKRRRFAYASKERDIQKKAADYQAGKQVGIEVIVEEDGTYGNWGPKGTFTYVPEPHLTLESIAAEIEKKSFTFERHWEREWLAQTVRIIKDGQIDRLIKEEILLDMLGAMREGTVSLKPMCDEVLEVLLSRKRDRENWFEPLEYKAELNDDITQRLQEGFKRVVERDKALRQMSAARIAYVGVVLPFDGGREDVASTVIIGKSDLLPSLSTAKAKYLFVVESYPKDAELVHFYKDGVTFSCAAIGVIERGDFKLNEDAFRVIPNGTPIFTIKTEEIVP